MNYEHERLVRAIIRTVIRKFEVSGIAEEDLFQEGMLALLKAERTYKADVGAKFETYASVVIHNRIVDVIRMHKEDPIDLTEDITPDNQQNNDKEELLKILHEVLDNCTEFEQAIFNAYFQGYSYQEICEIFGINKKKVDNTIQKIHRLARLIYAD